MIRLVISWFGAGYLRPAPGTWGSAAALPFAWLTHWAAGFPGLALATVAVFFIGWRATHIHMARTGREDPPEVVVDEVVGQWIALWPLSFSLWMFDIEPWIFWSGWISAFLLFRLFDACKIGPVAWADRRPDALGVMLDDVFAGIFAAVGILALGYMFHVWLP